jgi:hypothetical protein
MSDILSEWGGGVVTKTQCPGELNRTGKRKTENSGLWDQSTGLVRLARSERVLVLIVLEVTQ